MSVRLSKHFGNKPEYWLDIQAESDLAELSADKKFIAQLAKIPKAQKTTGKAKTTTKKSKVKTTKIKATKGKTAKKRGRQAKAKKK